MNWIYKYATGPVALISLIIFLVFTATVLPDQAAKAEENTGSTKSPDTSLFYSTDFLYDLAETYGEDGRSAYIRARFTFDLAWPAVYTFLLLATTGWLLKQVTSSESRQRKLILIPVLAVTFDLLENISTSLVMARYPATTAVIDTLAPIFTFLKWLLVGGSFLILVGALVASIRVRLGRRAGSENRG